MATQVINDLLGFHDCADGDVEAGNGHFRLVCISDSDQQRLNLRAVLREAAHDLDAAQARIQRLEAALKSVSDQSGLERFMGWSVAAIQKLAA